MGKETAVACGLDKIFSLEVAQALLNDRIALYSEALGEQESKPFPDRDLIAELERDQLTVAVEHSRLLSSGGAELAAVIRWHSVAMSCQRERLSSL